MVEVGEEVMVEAVILEEVTAEAGIGAGVIGAEATGAVITGGGVTHLMGWVWVSAWATTEGTAGAGAVRIMAGAGVAVIIHLATMVILRQPYPWHPLYMSSVRISSLPRHNPLIIGITAEIRKVIILT